MEFCKKCDNMYYVRVGGDSKLEYHCKQCGHFEEYYNDIQNCCIYKQNLGENHSVHDISINQYITKDPTLPRLNNINCVNKDCLTNNYMPHSALVYGIDIKLDHDEFLTFIKSNILKNSDLKLSFKRLDDKMGILTFDSDEILKENLDKIREIKYKKTEISCSELSNINREIIFIKYDSVNMKYLYICSTCNTSWKNN